MMATCRECLHYDACKYWIDTFKEQIRHDWEYVFADNCDDFKDKTKYVEQKHGRWLPQILLGERVWDCSECKTLGSPHWKWCPVCGAKMDGE